VIKVNHHLSIAEGEITLTHARSAGPGGQNVNKVSTKVCLQFDVAHSPSLDDRQRATLLRILATRISKAGILRLSSSRHRTQTANRRDVLQRFVDLLAKALKPRAVRHKTKPTLAAGERRLAEKTRRGRIKQNRRVHGVSDDQ
jgi:ribosome-associated protein